jgi:hypothetical protein
MPTASTNTESLSPRGMCTGNPLDVSRCDIAEPPMVCFGASYSTIRSPRVHDKVSDGPVRSTDNTVIYAAQVLAGRDGPVGVNRVGEEGRSL